MGLIYRTSSIANAGPSSIKNAALTYEEGDGNIAFLLTNLSGSNTIQGTTTISGPVQINDAVQMDGTIYVPNLTSTSQNSIVTFDSSTGRFYYTSSANLIVSNSLFSNTASFVTASNVWGPYNQNSVVSASHAVSASWAPFVATNTGSLLITASANLNTITFTKGDGSPFSITVDTGSAATTLPAPSDTFIQFNSASTFGATASFKYDYNRQVLNHGVDVNQFINGGVYSHAQGDRTYSTGDYSHAEGGLAYANGLYSHAEGYQTTTYGTASHAEGQSTRTGALYAWSGSWRLSHVTMSSVHGDVASSFNIGDRLYLYRTTGIVGQVYTDRIVTSSFYDNISGNTILGLNLSIGGTRREVYLGNIALDPNSWLGGGNFIIPADQAHSAGNNTTAIGYVSHTEGEGNVAYGRASHVEGFGNKAIGHGSHAEGYATEAIGDYSHTQGFFTQAAGGYQTVIGAYNISSSLNGAFIIGNGDFATRRNLLFAHSSSVQISGSLRVTGSAFIQGLTSASQANVLTYDSSTGQVFFTASSAIGGGGSTPTLQQVTTAGSSSLDIITAAGISIPGFISTASLVPMASPNNFAFSSSAGGYAILNVGSLFATSTISANAVTVKNNSNANSGQFTGTVSANRSYTIPDASGTLVLTVNGVSADNSGSITIPTGSAIATGSFLTTGSLSTTQQLSGSLNVTGSLNFFSGSTNAAKIENGWVVLSQVSMSLDFANDTAAAAGGVPLGGLYRNGNAISIRIA